MRGFINDKFVKIQNRQIVDIISCESYENKQTTKEKNNWCGDDYDSDSYICLKGTREVDSLFGTPLADRYYYSQQVQSLKTEWMSKNNLLRIRFIQKNNKKNFFFKNNWALTNKTEILYYTIEFDETDQCPPFNSTWIPILPMNSNSVKLEQECSEIEHTNLYVT